MLGVILAGGGGTRLWPRSRLSRPKQFLNLLGDRTLLELTRDRVADLVSPEQLFYAVTPATRRLLTRILPDVPADRILEEPERRDTGPAMGFAAAVLALSHPDEPLVFLPADHFIRGVERFHATLRAAEDLIRETGCLVDVGVPPTWPNPNLGYTRVGERVGQSQGVEVLAFRGHVEKPSVERAREFIASGEYLWHANYYAWTPRKFLAAFERYAPALGLGLRQIQQDWQRGDREAVARIYHTLEKVSIDFAVTEKLDPDQVRILKAPFDWSDVGLWSTLKELQQENPDDVVVDGGEHVGIDTRDCLVAAPPGKVVATVGIEGLIIVDTPDALLVSRKDRDQGVKLVVAELQERGRQDVV